MSDPQGFHRVLVADDDPLTRILLDNVLSAMGYETHLCEDGGAALEALADGRFSLLVTDLEMPRKSGLDLIRALRAAGNGLPVILISGDLTKEALALSEEAGGVRCLPKPFSVSRIKEAVRNAVPTSSR